MSSFNLNGAYKIYIGGQLLPQTPAKITYEHDDQTEVIRLANQKNLTIPRLEAPLKISFEFKLTYDSYPWTWINNVSSNIRIGWLDYLQGIKNDRKPIDFWVIRDENNDDFAYIPEGEERLDMDPKPNLTMKVLLTDWSFVEDAEDNSDFTVNVTFLEYCPQKNQEIIADLEHHLILNRQARGWKTRRGARYAMS